MKKEIQFPSGSISLKEHILIMTLSRFALDLEFLHFCNFLII